MREEQHPIVKRIRGHLDDIGDTSVERLNHPQYMALLRLLSDTRQLMALEVRGDVRIVRKAIPEVDLHQDGERESRDPT